MSKKILLIIGILAAVGIAAFLIFSSTQQTGSSGDKGFSIMNFMPFGKSSDSETGTTTDSGNDQSEQGQIAYQTNGSVPKLRKISSEPVAGAVIFNTGTTSIARFVEKGTGNVYETRSDSTKIQRLTNTTIPKIIRAFWLPNGSGFLAQTIDTDLGIIETSFVKLSKNSASSTSESLVQFDTTISKLPTGIEEIAINPDGSRIFYYIKNGSYSNWFVSNPDGTKSSAVLTHSLTEWLPKWVSGNVVIMQNKPSFKTEGFYYSFNISSGVLKKIGDGVSGLSSVPNSDGSLSIISNGGSSPALYLVKNSDATAKSVSANGLADKCVWADKTGTAFCAIPKEFPSGNYPDDWYKGIVATNDYVEKIDFNNDISYTISDLSSESGEKIDAADISVSSDNANLIFRNKIDGYLWMLRVED